jgi:hypothetical protein
VKLNFEEMKLFTRFLSLMLVSCIVLLTACDDGDGDEKSEQEVQIEKLVGTWNATSVTYNGDANTDYDNFSITITKSSNDLMTFTTSGRPAGKLSPWDASGTFTFGSPVTTKLIRGDGNVTVDYTVDGTVLQLKLTNFSGAGYQVPRTESVAGNWVFTFSK